MHSGFVNLTDLGFTSSPFTKPPTAVRQAEQAARHFLHKARHHALLLSANHEPRDGEVA